MRRANLFVPALLVLLPVLASAQGAPLNPADLSKPLGDSWPTYNGDYTGKRFSSLTQVNRDNVQHLTLAWMTHMNSGAADAISNPMRGGDREPVPEIVGGEGDGTINIHGGTIKGSLLEVNGTLYVTTPDNGWAVDAHSGRVLWHYFWKTKGGTHIGNRGFGMWKGYLYMATPDDFLVSLEAKTGKERWHKKIAELDEGYFSTMAPVVIGNHVLVGTGNDIDSPGFLQSFDPETGDLQWKHYNVPMEKGDPGLDTWKSLDAARHGGAQAWVNGVYDPETNLYIYGTGNPTPAYTTGTRGEGINLFTCSLIGVNVDTGKMAWYYQTSPHDMHDYDSAQTPVLVDGDFNGKPRKMVLTAARNGYFFVVDRTNGQHLLTSKWGKLTNWANGLNKTGGPERDRTKDATMAGSLASPNSGGTINWQPPTFSPETNLFYVPESDSFSIFYLTDMDPRGSMGLGGKEEAEVGSDGNYLTAIDYKTGKVVWRHCYYGHGGGGGLLSTAGGLVFASDGEGNFVAHDAKDGKPLWHTRIGNASNAAQTFALDGKQYVTVASGDNLWAFLMY